MKNLKRAAVLTRKKKYSDKNKDQVRKSHIFHEIEADLHTLGWKVNTNYLNHNLFTLESEPTPNTKLNLITPLLTKEELHINTVTKGEELVTKFMDMAKPDWTEINSKVPEKNEITDILPMSRFILSVPYPADLAQSLDSAEQAVTCEEDSERVTKPHLVFNCESVHSSLKINSVSSHFEAIHPEKLLGTNKRGVDLWYEMGNKYTGMDMEGMSVEWKLAIRELLNVYGIDEKFLIALENLVIEM